MCPILYTIFVEVVEHHPWVLSLQQSCTKGSQNEGRMNNIKEGFSFWPSALLQPRKGEGACYTKHIQVSQEMKTEHTEALSKASWGQWKTHLLIWTENQTYQNILGQGFKRQRYFLAVFAHTNWYDTGSSCLTFMNFTVCSPENWQKASFRCM